MKAVLSTHQRAGGLDSALRLRKLVRSTGDCVSCLNERPRHTQSTLMLLVGIVIAWLALLSTADAQANDDPHRHRTDLAITSPQVTAAAQFALQEIRFLSETGVYESLELAEIVNASHVLGQFHDNLILNVVFASPLLLAPSATSEHQVVVMKSLEDQGEVHVAIDEFPVFTDAAVQNARAARAVRSKQKREEFFARVEQEYLEEQAGHLEQLSARPELVRQEVNGMRARVLRALLETENLSKESRRMVQEVLDSRVEALIELEERVDE